MLLDWRRGTVVAQNPFNIAGDRVFPASTSATNLPQLDL